MSLINAFQTGEPWGLFPQKVQCLKQNRWCPRWPSYASLKLPSSIFWSQLPYFIRLLSTYAYISAQDKRKEKPRKSKLGNSVNKIGIYVSEYFTRPQWSSSLPAINQVCAKRSQPTHHRFTPPFHAFPRRILLVSTRKPLPMITNQF